MRLSISAMIIAFIAASPAWAQIGQVSDIRPKISVSGEAIVKVVPDKILISLGIETMDEEIITAKSMNNEILKKVFNSFKDLGVLKKDIQTDHISINPRYNLRLDPQELVGYTVRNTLVVTLTEIKKVEEVVSKALEDGVNYIHGIDFYTTELKKYREEARVLALKAAKEKAEKMASVLGQSAGPPIQISETRYGGGMHFGYYSSWSGWGNRSPGHSQNVVQQAVGRSDENTDYISLGKISVRANVMVIFELKD